MEKQLLNEILESYNMVMGSLPYTYDRGKGTKSYCIDRIKILRSRLLEMQKNVEIHYNPYKE